MARSRHDWKIVDWDVKPQHNQPTKSPFNQFYPKSVPNPDILIIWLPKNDKIVVAAKILF